MEVWEKIKSDLFLFLCVWAIGSALLSLFGYGLDSTDGDRRSGMSLHIDNRTGCHYLGGSGLTPRLDRNGRHICEGK